MQDKFPSLEDKASYAIGQQVGDHLSKHPFAEMNFEAVIEGLRDLVTKSEPQVNVEEQQQSLNEINARLQEEQQAKEQAQASVQQEAGAAFLKENSEREEVQVTDSGLQYEVLVEGDGVLPDSSSKVKVHYHGTLIDGTVFDSSVDRGEPLEFGVGQVISGWTEALQLMPVGSKWKLYIPHELAYGAQGAGATITPYSTLVFEVELLGIA